MNWLGKPTPFPWRHDGDETGDIPGSGGGVVAAWPLASEVRHPA